jgi:uncharacterized integral membrane protein
MTSDPRVPTSTAGSGTGPADPSSDSVDRPSGATGEGGADPLRRSVTSGAWLGVVALSVLLLLLIVFIAQNTQTAEVHFFGWDGEAPQAVTLLIAAAAGLVVALVAASLRILQLRRRVKRAR